MSTTVDRRRRRSSHWFELDGATIALVVTGVVTIITTSLAGLWQWLANKKKSEIEAQSALVAGFTALLTSIQAERDRLLKRVDECEDSNNAQDRRIIKLERLLLRHGIDIPNGETSQ